MFHTTVKFKAEAITKAVESSIAVWQGTPAVKAPKFVTYDSSELIPEIVQDTIDSGYRTLAIELPKDLPEVLNVAKETQVHLATSGKQLLYLAFYGSKKQLEIVSSQLSGDQDKTARLLLNKAPNEYSRKDVFSIKALSKQYSGTPFRLPGTIELSLRDKSGEMLLRSAFAEYMNLMKTKNAKEYHRLYRTTPVSKAVASFSCATTGGESVRLLVYDNEITKASAGKSAFLKEPYFCVTNFMSDAPEPTIILAGAKSEYY